MKYAVEVINKAGGIKSLGGAPLEMAWADSKLDPKVGVYRGRMGVILSGARPTGFGR